MTVGIKGNTYTDSLRRHKEKPYSEKANEKANILLRRHGVL